MSIVSHIRQSFSTQLTLWVAGFLVVTMSIVIFLLARFSQEVIRDETIDTTMQILENTALRIDNTLKQTELAARLEHQEFTLNRAHIEQLIEKNGSLLMLRKSLPNVQLYVTNREQQEGDDKDTYTFSQPLGDRPYCLAAVCPAQDVYGRYTRMQWTLLTWSIIAILSLIVILYFVIVRHLSPLHHLADSAQTIAEGNLYSPIHDTHISDETGRLQNSLSLMQRKLATYMEEMQQKQDTLNQQHAELQVAYNETKAYEEKKEKFLHDMTDRMAEPVEQLCRSTEAICRDYPNLSQSDMTALQADIMKGSETITELLDQLIKEPAAS